MFFRYLCCCIWLVASVKSRMIAKVLFQCCIASMLCCFSVARRQCSFQISIAVNNCVSVPYHSAASVVLSVSVCVVSTFVLRQACVIGVFELYICLMYFYQCSRIAPLFTPLQYCLSASRLCCIFLVFEPLLSCLCVR